VFQNEKVRFFHTFLSPKNPIYFLIVCNDSTYQILANACQFCFQAKSGFYVKGDHIICRVCETPYYIEEVATIQEGCSPLPIKTNLVAKEGKISFPKKILEKFISYF